MKTLDEVIQSIQLSSDVNASYRAEFADALEYLKEYRAKKAELNDIMTDYVVLKQYWAELASQNSLKMLCKDDSVTSVEDNPPLTWDELRDMEGKPVWLEFEGPIIGELSRHKWIIIRDIDDDEMWHDLGRCADRKGLGIHWKAYRKERE